MRYACPGIRRRRPSYGTFASTAYALPGGDGESAAARRARDPDAKFGGQRKPKRRDPGDDIWDNTDDFVWKDVLEKAENEDDMSSGFVVDEKGVLTLM